MKKILYLASIIALGTTISSCGWLSEGDLNDSIDTASFGSICLDNLEFETEHKHFRDSLEANGSEAYYDIDIDVPVSGPQALVDSIKDMIAKHLGKSWKGKKDFSDEMLAHYANEYYNETILASDSEYGFNSGLDMTFSVITNTEKFVTYEIEGYDYRGGAHGLPFSNGVTFDKTDGSQLGWEIFTDTTALAPIFKKYIAGYFHETSDVEIDEILFDEPAKKFPLPATAPWLVEDGVAIIYSAYEIAPYASGLPTATIPTAAIEKYLTPKAKELLKK